MEATLALHALAVMLIWVPFVVGGTLFDKLHEAKREPVPAVPPGSRFPRRWFAALSRAAHAPRPQLA